MFIKNFNSLSKTKLRKAALSILEKGLESVDTKKVISRNLKLKNDTLIVGNKIFKLSEFNNIYLVGIGKVAGYACGAIEKFMYKWITGGFCLDVRLFNHKTIKSFEGTHPFPTPYNVNITKQIIKVFQKAGKRDLIIFVISGGASSLFCWPYKMTCGGLENYTRALMNNGADIYEINTLRKHVSNVAGGQLAKIAYPAKVLGLVFSDVPGDDISMIGSGPISLDKTTIVDANKIIKKYKLPIKELKETPKDRKYFQNITTLVLASGKTALKAMNKEAKKRGYKTILIPKMTGEAREVGELFVRTVQQKNNIAVLAAGETTVIVKKDGRGGRNQELVLAGLQYLDKNSVLSALNTDGKDNIEGVAGAIGDKITIERAKKKKLNIKKHLEDNRSYVFFNKVGDHIKTGSTGINISDLVVMLKNKN